MTKTDDIAIFPLSTPTKNLQLNTNLIDCAFEGMYCLSTFLYNRYYPNNLISPFSSLFTLVDVGFIRISGNFSILNSTCYNYN